MLLLSPAHTALAYCFLHMRVCNVRRRTVTGVLAQSLEQRKTGFPADLGATLAFHLEAYLTEVQNQCTGSSIPINSRIAQASWHRLATFALFSSLCLQSMVVTPKCHLGNGPWPGPTPK